MKCKFTYLFSIASSPKDLLSNVQKYTNEHKPSVLTSDSRLVAPEASEVSIVKEDAKIEGDNSSSFVEHTNS